MNYQNNGRIEYVDNNIYPTYQMFHEQKKGLNQFTTEAVKTVLERNPVSDVFFSKVNIDYLQNKIIQTVYQISNGKHKIARQSDTELEIIMRSIYLQFSKNSVDNIKQQIIELDSKVVDDVVPGILTGIEQYLKYKEDITTMYKPIEHPRAENSKGEKSLEYKPFL